jgi:pimeloyl-ACP methyl ester carboxylesterase
MTRVLTMLALWAAMLAQAAADPPRSSFLFEAWDGPALRIFYTRPDTLVADRPVVFVMHGMSRTAERYRDDWHDLAVEHGFLLVVPEFTREDFPTSETYNSGNVIDDQGQPLPRSAWSFNAVEALFDDVRGRFGMTAEQYALYGHSAGSQFVHRFLLHVPEARVNRVVAANAGWYTVPDFEIGFPYGLQNSQVSEAAVRHFLELQLTVLLGDRDTDASQDNLRNTPEAKAQGPHRLARGWHFFNAAREAAQRLGTPFNWRLATVPGAHHDNALMAPEAVRYLLPEKNSDR